MRTILLLSVTAMLAACASTQDRCIRTATKNLRTVDTLIKGSRPTSRGAMPIRPCRSNVSVGVSYCGYSWGNIGVGVCAGNNTGTTRQPVSIDLEEERKKLAELERTRAALGRGRAGGRRLQGKGLIPLGPANPTLFARGLAKHLLTASALVAVSDPDHPTCAGPRRSRQQRDGQA